MTVETWDSDDVTFDGVEVTWVEWVARSVRLYSTDWKHGRLRRWDGSAWVSARLRSVSGSTP